MRRCALPELIKAVERGEAFSFTSWGETEWGAILGRHRPRKEGVALGICLRSILLSSPPYLLGMDYASLKPFRGAVERWLTANSLWQLDWVDGSILTDASDDFGDFLEVVRKRRPIVVGPPSSRESHDIFHGREFVLLPPKNRHLAVPDISRDILAAVERIRRPCPIVIEAGSSSKSIIGSLYPRIGEKWTLWEHRPHSAGSFGKSRHFG